MLAGPELGGKALRERNHFLNDLCLITEPGKGLLQLAVELSEFSSVRLAIGLTKRLAPLPVRYGRPVIQSAHLLDKVGQDAEIVDATADFRSRDQMAKALLRRMGEEPFCPVDVLVGGETNAVEDLSHLAVCILHSFDEGGLCLARERLRLIGLLPPVLNGGILAFEMSQFLCRRVSGGFNRLDSGWFNKIPGRLAQCSPDCGQVVEGQIIAGKGVLDHFECQVVSLGLGIEKPV